MEIAPHMRAARAVVAAAACVLVALLGVALPTSALGAGHDHHAHTAQERTAANATARARAKAKPARVQRWSSPATWGGRGVPRNGTRVTIPTGKTVVLDRSVSLRSLTVNGTLIFARRNLTLEADWIMVHGALRVGTAKQPFTQRATIRLRDRVRGENLMRMMGDKVIAVMGGRVEVFGQRRPGWTRLAATAPRGSRTLRLATNPRWRVGDRIAIASTDFARSQEEEATITRVRGRTVTLDRALEHGHFGRLQRYAGRRVDERAEVALLSRNVVIEADEASSARGVGAQVMAMDGATLQFDGVELRRVGQLGQLRRYPIHFHMLGARGRGSFVRNTSVHHSFNRCITIHGTDHVRLAGNVCFDHVGHGIFFEDGGERDNVLTNNLVFGTRAAEEGKRLLPSDDTPGSYWITNPDNVVRGNVAAGSDGHGFWIALPEHPTGLFATMHPAATKTMWPRRTALGEFRNNVAHSNQRDGVHFDRGPRPDGHVETTHHHARANPTDTDSRTVVTTLRNLRAWKNRGYGAWLRGTEHRLVGAVLSDNAIGTAFASQESFLQDSLVVGETANVGEPERWELRAGDVGRGGRSAPRPWDADFPVRGFEFYDGRVGVERTTFVNFQPWTAPGGERREQSALGYNLDNDFTIHPRNFARQVRFVNARPVYLETPEVGRDGDMSAVFVDADGSVAGRAGRVVTTLNPFLAGAGCEQRAEWNVQLCSGDYASLLVGASTRAAVRPVTLTRADGRTQTLMANTGDGATEATSTILTNAAYRVAFNGGTPTRAKFVLWRGAGRWVRIALPHSQQFRVMRYGCNVGEARSWCSGAATSLAALDAQDRSGYFYDDHGDADPATGTLHLRLVASEDWDELVVERR